MTLRCCFSASMWHWSNVISSTTLICFQHIQVKTLLWHLFFTVKTPSLYLKPLGVVLDDLKINPAICNITIHSVFMKADSPFHCFSFESSVVRPYLTFLFSNVINYVRLFLFAILHSSLTFIGYITSLLFKVSVWINLLWKDSYFMTGKYFWYEYKYVSAGISDSLWNRLNWFHQSSLTEAVIFEVVSREILLVM